MIIPFEPLNDNLSGIVLLSLVALLLAVTVPLICHAIQCYRSSRAVWKQFRRKAREKGLNEPQQRLLLRLSRQKNVKNPERLLTSLHTFNRYVGRYTVRLPERHHRPDSTIFEDIAQIRTTLGFDNLKFEEHMRTTRELGRGQQLKVCPERSEREVSLIIISRDDRSIVAAPLFKDASRHLASWQTGDRLAVHLWRDGDAEYRFQSSVLACPFNPEETSVQSRSWLVELEHSECVERIQMRKFFRLNTNFQISMYPVAREAYQSRNEAGLDMTGIAPQMGMVHNISGGGMKVVADAPISPEMILVIDPKFVGSFPLSGIACKIVGETHEDQCHGLRLEFIDIPHAVEAAIVRTIYQQQIGKKDLQPSGSFHG